MSELGTHLEIDTIENGFRLTGEIDAHTAPALSAALDPVSEDGGVVALDLAGVTFMDSSGLRVIIATTEQLRSADGDLVLRHPTDIVQRLLAASGLTEHLSIERPD